MALLALLSRTQVRTQLESPIYLKHFSTNCMAHQKPKKSSNENVTIDRHKLMSWWWIWVGGFKYAVVLALINVVALSQGREREREVKKDFSKSNIEVNLITQWCCRFSFVHSKQLYLFQCTYRNGILPNSTIPLCNSTNRSTMLLDPYLSALQHVFLPVLSHLTIDELTT